LRSYILACLVSLIGLLTSCAPTLAATPAPALTIHALALPTNFSTTDNAGCESNADRQEVGCDGYQVTVTNVGGATAAGPIALTDTLPAGVNVVGVEFSWSENSLRTKSPFETSAGEPLYPRNLEGVATTLCETETAPVRAICEFPPEVGVLHPDQRLQMDLYVTVQAGASAGENTASVAEAGVTLASESRDDVLDATPPSFGLSGLVSEISGTSGTSDTQAGDHPYGLDTMIDFNTKMQLTTENSVEPAAVGQPRDLIVDLPPGVLGSAAATPKCTFGQLQSAAQPCPLDTLVGHIASEPTGTASVNSALYNMVAEQGHAVEFGYIDALHGTHALYADLVPTPAGYSLRIFAHEVPQAALASIIASFYGDPAASQEEVEQLAGKTVTPTTPAAMFTNPADCSGKPLQATVYTDSWEHPGAFNTDGSPDLEGPGWVSQTVDSPPVTGCGRLHFNPAFTFAPESEHRGADEPAGYESVLTVPQSETPGTLATPPLKTAVVTLPAGVSISPAAADGLVGCQESGPEGINFASAGPGDCPGASKVGTVEAATPLLPERLREGSVYMAQPSCAGAGQAAGVDGEESAGGRESCTEALAEAGGVFALYLEAGSRASGIHIKLRGKVEVGGNGDYSREHGLAPGRLRVSLLETPQFPIGELKLKFHGGPGALLANPQTCGTFTTDASLEPWSHTPAPGEAEGTPNVLARPSFEIAGCEAKFAPSFTADASDPQAGAYSPFTLTFGRADREQGLAGLSLTTPPGLLANLTSVTPCTQAQAVQGACPRASEIGAATVAAGAGSEPLYLGGHVYLTGPYNGAPYGLLVVVPAQVGPFQLGDVDVRASIAVNPTTAALTIATDPLPRSIDGIPLRLRTVNVEIGGVGGKPFFFNPTNCDQQSIAGTISSAQGASAVVSNRFQVGACAELKFKPKLTASTAAHAEALKGGRGASLNVELVPPHEGPQSSTSPSTTGSSGTSGTSGSASGSAAQTEEANIRRIALALPRLLPARLQPTLQHACTAARFAQDPADCPPDSFVGTATVRTPVLAGLAGGGPGGPGGDLSGPAIFVSNGGASLPDLDLVLQGDGVEILLTGRTDVKGGVTYAKFETVPDAPISAFDLKLPEGPHSALASGLPTNEKSLCGQSLEMPARIEGQNGAVLEQITKVRIDGCKPALYIRSTKVSGRTVTLTVTVPAAGGIAASGAGLSGQAKHPAGEKLVTLKLTLSAARAAKLSTRHGLKTRVELVFTPRRGRRLAKSVAVGFGPA
jgi:uncharacterized repeat protein (TIGR01451 family)